MARVLMILMIATVAGLAAQQPAVQNGRIETRTVTSIERELSAVGPGADPVWVGWQVALVPGDRNLCSTWSDGSWMVRGEILEGRPAGQPPVPLTPPAGPVSLERGTALVVLARVVGGRLERLRAISDDCQIDAGGRTIRWLTGVTAAASVQFLDGLTRGDLLGPNRRIADAAVFAIGLHDDPAATATLDRLSGTTTDSSLRRQAASALASSRGQVGVERVRALIRDEPDRSLRQHFVSALAQSPQPDVTSVLLALARSETDASVRGEAASRYVRRAGASGLPTVLTLIDRDQDDAVRRRIVSAIGSLPSSVGTPTLIQLARSHTRLDVRKEAVAALGRSSDPSARALLEELLR